MRAPRRSAKHLRSRRGDGRVRGKPVGHGATHDAPHDREAQCVDQRRHLCRGVRRREHGPVRCVRIPFVGQVVSRRHAEPVPAPTDQLSAMVAASGADVQGRSATDTSPSDSPPRPPGPFQHPPHWGTRVRHCTTRGSSAGRAAAVVKSRTLATGPYPQCVSTGLLQTDIFAEGSRLAGRAVDPLRLVDYGRVGPQ